MLSILSNKGIKISFIVILAIVTVVITAYAHLYDFPPNDPHKFSLYSGTIITDARVTCMEPSFGRELRIEDLNQGGTAKASIYFIGKCWETRSFVFTCAYGWVTTGGKSDQLTSNGNVAKGYIDRYAIALSFWMTDRDDPSRYNFRGKAEKKADADATAYFTHNIHKVYIGGFGEVKNQDGSAYVSAGWD